MSFLGSYASDSEDNDDDVEEPSTAKVSEAIVARNEKAEPESVQETQLENDRVVQHDSSKEDVPASCNLVADESLSFNDVVDIYIKQGVARGSEYPPEYKAEIMEVYNEAPPEGKEQMLRDMRDLVNKQSSGNSSDEGSDDEAEEERDIQEARAIRTSTPISFESVVDEYIAQGIASGGGGPPPEYKAQILEVYQNAPPEGQEQMLHDMLKLVREQANEAADSERDEQAKKQRKQPIQEDHDSEMTRRSGSPPMEEAIAKKEPLEAAAAAPVEKEPNPLVFFEIAVDGTSIGHIEFELFADIAPKTAENFRCLCTGEKSRDKAPLSYLGSVFHRIIPGFMCQGGDFTKGNGTGGESIYGPKFDDENFQKKHTKGCLSMANSGPNTNGSQFFICTDAPSHLDGKHVVFGEVVAGYDVVQRMEALGSRSGRTTKKVTIKNCGMVNTGESQAAKRQRLIDVAPAARIIHEFPAEDAVPGGLLGLLQMKDADKLENDATTNVPSQPQQAAAHCFTVEKDRSRSIGGSDEIHCLHILRKHVGSRKPKSRGGQPVTCSQEEAEEYLEEIGVQLIGLPPAELRKQFSALAKTESDCASAAKGGDVGRFKRGQRQKPFEDAAFALGICEMSDIVNTDSGVHLILRVA